MKKARKARKRKVAPRSRAIVPAARYITREDLATLCDEIMQDLPAETTRDLFTPIEGQMKELELTNIGFPPAVKC